MAIRCFRCGTMFTGIECPTCKQRKLSEERNRLLQEQNKNIELQNKEIEKQTRIQEQIQRDAEQERYERQSEIEREENNEKFNSRVDELINYADERNLITAFVYFQSNINKFIGQTTINEWMTVGIWGYDLENIIENTIKGKCLHEFYKFRNELNSDDRIIDCNEYGKCFRPKIKLSFIKQIANNHSEDYVILPQPDQSLLIFPTNLAANNSSIKGYENKDIQIGEFRFLMFLRDADEAKKIAQILSDAYKRIKSIHTIIDEVKKLLSEYLKNNPKPQPVKPKEPKSYSGILFIIFGIIAVILVGFIGYKISEFENIILKILVGALAFLVVGFKIGGFIGSKIDDKVKDKIYQQRKMNEETFEKILSDWKTNLNKTVRDHIEKQSFNDVSGKFLIIEDKGMPNET